MDATQQRTFAEGLHYAVHMPAKDEATRRDAIRQIMADAGFERDLDAFVKLFTNPKLAHEPAHGSK